MQVKNKKHKPSLKKRIKSESLATTFRFVHSTKIFMHNNTKELSFYSF